MLHNLADAAARRLGRHGFSEARYARAVEQLVAAYAYWLEEEIAAEEAYSRCATSRPWPRTERL
jgi:alkanesulfonate monooxygenase SsuD/methylene tetrahydromethanopterin reductase-like flavin-dependent oxidoreductase (luciferase family)